MYSSLLNISNAFLKMAEVPLTIFTFVPRSAIISVKKKGLLSGAKLIKDPEALKAAHPKNTEKFVKSVEKSLADPEWADIVHGISAFYSLPDWEKIPDKHFIFKKDLVPIEINLSKLLADKPETKLLGVELEKYNPNKKEQPNRERYITLKEVEEIKSQNPSKIWKHYEGQIDKYAPDVPHLVIMIDKIPTKYLLL